MIPGSGEIQASRLKALPFGIARPPDNWGIVLRLIQNLLLTKLFTPTMCFVDDIYSRGRESTVMSAFATSRELIALTGLEISEKR